MAEPRWVAPSSAPTIQPRLTPRLVFRYELEPQLHDVVALGRELEGHAISARVRHDGASRGKHLTGRARHVDLDVVRGRECAEKVHNELALVPAPVGGACTRRDDPRDRRVERLGE